MNKSSIKLLNAKCVHNIPIRTGYGGEVRHIIIFLMPNNTTYSWVTSTGGYNITVGEQYDIEAKLTDDPTRIKNPRFQIHKESEQPDENSKTPVDVFDLIYNTNICYALDKRLKMWYDN